MFKWFWKWVDSQKFDPITEGRLAHEYKDDLVRVEILNRYQKRYTEPKVTPLTHPWRFDPLDPPQGWAWDPYYELWLSNDNN